MKSKSRELLEALTVAELKVFRNYLNSPYFNCGTFEKLLFEKLIEEIHEPEKEKATIYKSIFPGKKYDDKYFRYGLSRLNKHLINFFKLRNLEKDPLLNESVTAKALSARDCEKSYLLLHHEIANYDVHLNAASYHYKFDNSETYLTYTGNKLSRKDTPDYSDTLLHLDTFYLIKKLQLSCEIANISNILKKTYKIELLDSLKKLAKLKPYCDIPMVQIYFHILEMLTEPKPENHFIEVNELLKLHSDKIHPKELSEMFQYLKNYCVRKVNQGDTEFLRTLFNIYVTMLGNNSLMKYDYLSQWEFKNIVSISLRINEKEWCKNFIQKYSSYLKPEERENAVSYNLSYFLFIDQNYHKAIRKLQEVALNDVFYQLDARVILLKCYFELDDTDSFFYQASAFRLFLLRNRHISDYQKNIYRNLIKFLSAIVRGGNSKNKLLKISAEIEEERNVADLNYLRTKVAEAIAAI